MLRASALALALLASPWAAAHADGPIVLAQAETYTAYDIQEALSRAGYYRGPIDGSMGPGTRRAISNFQADNSLPVTGSPTNSLLGELRARGHLAAGPRSSYGEDPLIADVQAALRNRGYDVRVSGALDTQTRSAIRSFQRQQGLPATGQATPELLALVERGGGAGRGAGEFQLVRQIERRLANKGYNVGAVDGSLDAQTQQAIRTYQAQRGLAITGEPSEQLLADLRTSTVTAQSARVPQTPEEAAGAVLRGLGERLQNR